MKIYFNLIRLGVLACLLAASAQTIRGQQSLNNRPALPLPNCYKTMYEGMPITGNGPCTLDNSNDVWVVYAAREGTRTTTSRELKFMDAFFVAEDDGARLHLVKHDPNSVTRQKNRYLFRAGAEDYGWVDKRELILWPSALKDAKTGFFVSALIINDIQMGRTPDQSLILYNTFDLAPSGRLGAQAYRLNVYYVIRAEGDAYLLSTSPALSIDPQKTRAFIKGWVRRTDVVRWNNRMALEPALSPAAVAERKRASTRSVAFWTREATAAYISSGNLGTERIWDSDPLSTTWAAANFRMPYFQTLSNGDMVEVGAIGVSGASGVDCKASADSIAVLKDQIERFIIRSRKVNVIFVMDGSAPLAPYLERVSNAVIACASLQGISANEIKFGGCVYREYASSGAISTLDLTSETSKYESWIKEQLTRSLTTDLASPPSQALFQGIEAGINLFNGREGETNLMILVGGPGNSLDDNIRQNEAIAEQLAKYRIGLMAYQPYNSSTDFQLYIRFGKDARGLLDLTCRKMGEQYPGFAYKMVEKADAIEGKIYSAENPYTAYRALLLEPDHQLPTSYFEQQVVELINEADARNNELINGLRGSLEGIMRGAGDLKCPPGLSEDACFFLRSKCLDYFARSYVPMKRAGLTYPLFDFVVMQEQNELGELIGMLKKLTIPGISPSKRREALYEVVLELAKDRAGSVTKSDINIIAAKSLRAFICELISLPPERCGAVTGSQVPDVPIEKIRDPKVLPDDQITNFVRYIADKVERMETYSNNDKNRFFAGEKPFYWVPVSLLP